MLTNEYRKLPFFRAIKITYVFFTTLFNYCRFVLEYFKFKRISNKLDDRFVVRWFDRQPSLKDRTANTNFDRHYIYHTAWAARILKKETPNIHHDFGSSLFFVGMISAFYQLKFYDYRPANLELSNLTTSSCDLQAIPFGDKTVKSVSCMHVIEHIGLGRYGDNLDPIADLKAMKELQRIVADGGSLLLVVPVGTPRIQYNAHRIYGYEQIVKVFNELVLVEFALIKDWEKGGGLFYNVNVLEVLEQSYGCGCFHFKRQLI